MPFKDVKKRRDYRREWYAKNKHSEKKHVKNRKIKIRKWFFEYKKKLSCSKCKENHPATLDFHHAEGTKEKNISFLTREGYSIERIKKEIGKCTPLCSNCHRKLHYKQKHLKKFKDTQNYKRG